jgi:hypothetical protein
MAKECRQHNRLARMGRPTLGAAARARCDNAAMQKCSEHGRLDSRTRCLVRILRTTNYAQLCESFDVVTSWDAKTVARERGDDVRFARLDVERATKRPRLGGVLAKPGTKELDGRARVFRMLPRAVAVSEVPLWPACTEYLGSFFAPVVPIRLQCCT